MWTFSKRGDIGMSPRADPRVLWMVVAVASPVAEIASYLTFGAVPHWLLEFRLLVLAAILVASIRWPRAEPMRAFCLAYAFQQTIGIILATARGSHPHRSLVTHHGFAGGQLVLHILWMALLTPAILWVLRRSDRFYFRAGNLAARVDLTRIGLGSATLRWSVLGPVLAVVSTLCAWTFVIATGVMVQGSPRMVPWAVLFATINAFGEEAVNRNLLIGAIKPEYGGTHAVAVSALIFGVDHWRGLPGGLIGVLMTCALALVAGRAMVDTKGVFWSWFIHALPDCVLFYYWGIGAVGHGSR